MTRGGALTLATPECKHDCEDQANEQANKDDNKIVYSQKKINQYPVI